MKLSNFSKNQIEMTIQALIMANTHNFLGTIDTDTNVDLGLMITEREKEFVVSFLVHLYPDAEEEQMTDEFTFSKEDEYSKLIKDVCNYIIYTYNEYDGYETKEDYLY